MLAFPGHLGEGICGTLGLYPAQGREWIEQATVFPHHRTVKRLSFLR
jgi:hypothetical protein